MTQTGNIGTLNPFRYRGYYYDNESGLYYLNNRYYDPIIGRFVNADSQINGDLGVLGGNQYAYCLNNPSNKIDLSGYYPGDLFPTMDAAARDFGMVYRHMSLEEDREYASSIYEVKVEPIFVVSHKIKWVMPFDAVYEYPIYLFTDTFYSYTKPNAGTHDTSKEPHVWFKKKVGYVHTHTYDPKLNMNNFSLADKNIDIDQVAYLVTPTGHLLRYQPGFCSVTINVCI